MVSPFIASNLGGTGEFSTMIRCEGNTLDRRNESKKPSKTASES